jgi:L-fucose mutarotase
MLKGIPEILSPDLLKVLAEMGHGDDLVIADVNYPAASTAKHCGVLVRLDGHANVPLLDAILQFFPLDASVEKPVTLMQVQACDSHVKTPIWDEYKALVAKYDSRGADAVGSMERFEFYERAKKAYAVVATGEKALYGCLIIKKGCVKL